MASITPNNRSMNGINQIETSSISFPDGTTINTNDFASQADVSANQAAIAANTSSLSSKEDLFSVSAPLLKTTGSPNTLSIDTNDITGIVSGNNQLITGGGIYRYLLDNYNAKLTNDSPQQLLIRDSGSGIDNNDKIGVNLATSPSQTDFGLVSGKVLDDGLATKQDTISVTAPIEKSGSTISVAYDTSPSSFGGNGNLITSNGVFNALQSKQDTLTTGDGINLTSNEISLDLSTLNSTVVIPQRVQIVNNSTSQLVVKTQTTNGASAAITIRGAQSTNTNLRQAQLRFENYDINLADHNDLGEIAGVVSNATTNVGGLHFSNFSDGSTRRVAATMNNNGNWNFGTSFQDDYRLKVEGDAHVSGRFESNRFVLEQNGYWGRMRIKTGSNHARLYLIADDTNYNVYMYIDGAQVQTSDDRIKENETLIENATETLQKLTPQIYDKYGNMNLTGTPIVESGLVTQEVYYNAPELRHLVLLGEDTDEDGNNFTPVPEELDLSGVDIQTDPDYGSHGWSKTNKSSLNYIGLIPYLIKSNQELAARIEALENNR